MINRVNKTLFLMLPIYATLSSCGDVFDDCESDASYVVKSPNADAEIVVWRRACGATVGPATVVVVRKSHDSKGETYRSKGKIFAYQGSPGLVSVRWSDITEITVEASDIKLLDIHDEVKVDGKKIAIEYVGR